MAGVGQFSNLKVLQGRKINASEFYRSKGNEVILYNQQGSITQDHYSFFLYVPVIYPEIKQTN